MIDSTKFMDINGLSYIYNKLLERLGLLEDQTIENIENFKKETLNQIYDRIDGIEKILDGKTEEAINAALKVDEFMKECESTYATKKEVNSMINNLVSFEISVVSTLPKKGIRGTIYLILADDGYGDDIYNEYVWVPSTSKFEKIGTTRIDLTPYEKIEHAESTYVKKIDYNIKVSELEKADADNLAASIADAASKYVTQSIYNDKIAELERKGSDNFAALEKADANNFALLQKADENNLAAAKEDAAAKYLRLNGNAVTASRLFESVNINDTSFDGTTSITTQKWGRERNIYISDSDRSNVGPGVTVDGSEFVTLKLPSTIKATIDGNSSSTTRLVNPRSINGMLFDGTADITTPKWGESRKIRISDNDGINIGAATSVDGSGDITIKLPSSLSIGVSGNADTATKLATARTINGTLFDGTADITTQKWGESRNIFISDYTGTYIGDAISMNGSGNVTLKLPSNIKATSFVGSLSGNADTASRLQTSRTISLTGSVTGSGTFDGSGNLSIDTTTSHTHLYAGSSTAGGVANSATKLATARTIQTNLGSTSSASFDGTADITPGVTGTLPISNGGTGATTKKAAEYNILNGLSEDTSDVSDSTMCVCNYQNTSSKNGVLYIRKFSNIWEYIKGKVCSEFGLEAGGVLSGNASSAQKLYTARSINGTLFDGTADITTNNWGTARNIYIADSDGSNTGAAVSVNGSGNATLNLPATIKANLIGNASTASKLATGYTINGTLFDGSANITTDKWGEARDIRISDNDGLNTGAAVSVNGIGNVTLKLPATIKANLSGNASNALYAKYAEQVYSNVRIPDDNSVEDARFAIPIHTDAGTVGYKELISCDGIQYYRRQYIHTGSKYGRGMAAIRLGNKLDADVNGNKSGEIHLLGPNMETHIVAKVNDRSNIYNTVTLPDVNCVLSYDYKSGDSFSFSDLNTSGYVTSEGRDVRFTLPISRPIPSSLIVTASSVDGIRVRQNGSYAYGSSAGGFALPSSYTVTNNGNFLSISAIFNNPSGYANNTAAGIAWSGRIIIS